MKHVDQLCAWVMFITAAIFLVMIELSRTWGVGFDTPLFWMLVAMINFLRLRNDDRHVEGMRTFSIIANLMVLLLEIIRLGEWGSWILRNWGLYYIITTLWRWIPYVLISTAAAAELTFSVIHKDGSTEAVSA